MVAELKPCPFCSGEPKHEKTGYAPMRYWIECGRCRASCTSYPDRAHAISAWNCRSALETPPECRIKEYDGAFKCYTHNRAWGAVPMPETPCAGWVAPAETPPEYVGNPCICVERLALQANPDCPIHGMKETSPVLGHSTGFTHWSKDPLIPYADCHCQSCNDARSRTFVANVSDGTG